MAYEVLARKWRPKTFDDVVGQEHVTRTLGNAIAANRIAHAYLFIGPRGIGKTTLSRIFAMALNCAKGPTLHPCGECDNCKSIAASSDMDVVELDAASNNKVEDIHRVLEQVQFAPSHSRFKIFILDEVHMLSTAAFNALLKTLEEPPPYVKFIFATTEGDKVLPTIVSRCQRFDLRRISVGDITRRLRFICNAEKIAISDDALLAIARGSNGGLRDALSALDQLIAFKGTDLQESDVLAVFGLVSRETLERLAGSILQGDIPAILRSLNELDASGKDMRRLTAELLWHFRNLLVFQQAGAELAKQDVTAEQLQALEQQSGLAQPQRIVEITGLLSEMEGKLRSALTARTLVEMTLIRCARAATTVSLDDVIKRLSALREQVIRRLAAAAPHGPAAAPAAQPRAAFETVPAAPAVSPLSAASREEDAAPSFSDDGYEPAEDEPFDSFYREMASEPAVSTLVERSVGVETLQSSDGRYVDEILNLAIRLFGGTPCNVIEKA